MRRFIIFLATLILVMTPLSVSAQLGNPDMTVRAWADYSGNELRVVENTNMTQREATGLRNEIVNDVPFLESLVGGLPILVGDEMPLDGLEGSGIIAWDFYGFTDLRTGESATLHIITTKTDVFLIRNMVSDVDGLEGDLIGIIAVDLILFGLDDLELPRGWIELELIDGEQLKM